MCVTVLTLIPMVRWCIEEGFRRWYSLHIAPPSAFRTSHPGNQRSRTRSDARDESDLRSSVQYKVRKTQESWRLSLGFVPVHKTNTSWWIGRSATVLSVESFHNQDQSEYNGLVNLCTLGMWIYGLHCARGSCKFMQASPGKDDISIIIWSWELRSSRLVILIVTLHNLRL